MAAFGVRSLDAAGLDALDGFQIRPTEPKRCPDTALHKSALTPSAPRPARPIPEATGAMDFFETGAPRYASSATCR